MRSYAHPVHSGAAVALFSTAPSFSATLTTREPVLIANYRGRVWNCSRQGFDCGVNLKLGIIVSQWVVTRLGCRVSCSGRGEGILVTGSPRFRDAAVMYRLLTATTRRVAADSKTGKLCLVCGSSSSRNEAEGEQYDKKAELEDSPPQDAVLKAISEVSKAEGRIGKTTNIVIGGTLKDDSESEWNAIDQKVNFYPMVRDFTAIGTGGDEFVQAMVQAVESITEFPVPKVTKKLSSQGKYVSVKIGGITVLQVNRSALSMMPCERTNA